MTDYLNSNGLVNGKIPAGTACAFAEFCGMRDTRCPTRTAPREVDYSCAAARLQSMIALTEEKP